MIEQARAISNLPVREQRGLNTARAIFWSSVAVQAIIGFALYSAEKSSLPVTSQHIISLAFLVNIITGPISSGLNVFRHRMIHRSPYIPPTP